MKHFRKYFPGIKSEAGATLVVIIIAMVVVAILGAGMLALFSTSLFNQTEAQKTAKAYYLAESGVRVAASEFLHATNQNQMLVDLQDKTFNIPGTGGSFKLHLYPYWFYVTTPYAAGATSIKLYLPGAPGSLPPANSDSLNGMDHVPPGILKLKDKTSVGVFTDAPVGTDAGGTFVTFTISAPGFPYAISPGNELYIGYTYNSPQSFQVGGDLVFNDPNHTAMMYPPTNGAINIRTTIYFSQYTYESRIPQTIDPSSPPASFTLHNIQKANTDAINTFMIDATTQIYIGQTLGIRSKSEYVN
jgi:type II secretory pathway pseudopilin PulG